MEQKKLLWVIFSAVGFIFIVAAAGLVLFWPKGTTAEGAGEEPAAGITREFDPVEWVREGRDYPGIEEETETDEGDNLILVYGESESSESEAGSEEAASAEEDGTDTGPQIMTGKDGVEIEVYQPEKAERETISEPERPAETEPQEPVTKRLTEYWIQAGSYTSRTRADEVKQELSEKGIASVVTTKAVDGADYYRVRIGPYGSKAEAEKFLGWIQGVSGFESSYISMVYVTRRIN